jgi:hypothetical protein
MNHLHQVDPSPLFAHQALSPEDSIFNLYALHVYQLHLFDLTLYTFTVVRGCRNLKVV